MGFLCYWNQQSYFVAPWWKHSSSRVQNFHSWGWRTRDVTTAPIQAERRRDHLWSRVIMSGNVHASTVQKLPPQYSGAQHFFISMAAPFSTGCIASRVMCTYASRVQVPSTKSHTSSCAELTRAYSTLFPSPMNHAAGTWGTGTMRSTKPSGTSKRTLTSQS
jgi:hypothetical protein